MEGEVSHGVLQGSVLAAVQLRIYSMIQRMHIKFSDSMNPRGNKSTAEVKIFSTKKEINFVGKGVCVCGTPTRMHPIMDKMKIL